MNDMMRTANPVLNNRTFTRLGGYAGSNTMTIQGTVVKTAIMLLLAVFSASVTWRMASQEGNPMPLAIGGAIGGFVLVLATMFMWWRDIIREAEYQGHHTPIVHLLEDTRVGLREGAEALDRRKAHALLRLGGGGHHHLH